MELKLIRRFFSEKATIGELYVNGSFLCNTLEDVDRGLYKDMPLEELIRNKVKTKTAIPYGTYTVANTYSPRFQKYLPLLLDVPAYSGIRIHPGNKALDTEGCILPGVYDCCNPD